MQTKLSALAANLAEYGWLAALVVAPVFFNPHTARIFEEDKALLLRSIALLILVGLIVWLVEEGRPRLAGRPFWRLPLIRPAAALTACYLVSTAVSIAPSVSFWGAYIRAQGTYTWLAYLTVFAAVVLLVRERAQLERLVTVVLLASVPAAVYGVIQHFGHDPIAWGADVTGRASGTAGNAIFLGGYLIMVVPLTLARLVSQAAGVAARAREAAPLRLRLVAWCLLCAYALLLALQLLTIVYSQSRGPFLGLIAGLAFFFIVFALHRRLRWLTIATATALVAGGLFLVVFNLPHTPLKGLRTAPYVGRLGQIADVSEGTGKVRVLIWQGAVELLADEPKRALLGYGPETLFLAYNRFYPPELAHYERRGTTPDRSHNETFDALIMTGALGLLAQLAVFLSFFACTLQWLGMIRSIREQRAFFGAATLGAAAGVVLPYLVDGGFRFAGVGLPAGMAVGLLSYLVAQAVAHVNDPTSHPGSDELLLIGLLAAVMAHFVEIHFGIGITATRLHFWTYAGLAVAIGTRLVTPHVPASPAPPATAASAPDSSSPQPLLSGNLVAVSPIVGLILVLLTFSFYRRSLDLATHGPALGSLAGGVWLVGALLIAAEPGERRDWLARLIGYSTTTLGIGLLFLGIYTPRVDRVVVARQLTPEIVNAFAAERSHTITILYAFVFLIVIFSAAVATFRDRPLPARLTRLRGWWPAIYPLLLVVAALAVERTNLASARADTFSKQGMAYEQQGQWEAAATVYEHALRLRPAQDRYELDLARVLVERARRDFRNPPAERFRLLEAALAAMQRAQRISPLNPDHPRGLAKVHRAWVLFTDDPEERTGHVARAQAAYERATALSPNNAALWNEWATMFAEQGQPERSLAILDRALQVDARYPKTYWLRAEAHLVMDRLDDAVADYDRALALDPNQLAAWSGKALALARLGRTDEAIAANQEALRIAPHDLISQRNLAVLYQQTGRLDLALQAAEAALALAQGDDRPPLERFIEELRDSAAR